MEIIAMLQNWKRFGEKASANQLHSLDKAHRAFLLR
jgi:hypothetical protein